METTTTLIAAIQNAIGNRVVSNYNSATAIANRALSYVCGYHNWQWLTETFTADLVQSQDWVALPFNTMEIITIGRTSNNGTMRVSTLDEIYSLREQNVPVCADLLWAMAWDALSPAGPYLEIYPTPTVASVATIQGIMRRKVDDLFAADDIPQIPIAYHSALVYVCRAFAKLEEEGEMGEEMTLAKALLDDLVKKDGMSRHPGQINRIVQHPYPDSPEYDALKLLYPTSLV